MGLGAFWMAGLWLAASPVYAVWFVLLAVVFWFNLRASAVGEVGSSLSMSSGRLVLLRCGAGTAARRPTATSSPVLLVGGVSRLRFVADEDGCQDRMQLLGEGIRHRHAAPREAVLKVL